MAHTLSVECASLWIWINPLLPYHSLSHWILSVMRHQESEPWNQVLWVWAGFKSQPCGFMSQVEFWLGLSPSHLGLSPKQGFDWVQVPSRVLTGFKSQAGFGWVLVPGHGFKSQYEVNGFTTRDQSSVPCIIRHFLNHWTTSKVPTMCFSYHELSL